MVDEQKVVDKKLHVQISMGNLVIKFNAFLNAEKIKPQHPDFKGRDIAVWVNDVLPRNKDEKKDGGFVESNNV